HSFSLLLLQLLEDDLTLTRRTGQSVSFSCGGTDQCGSNYVYWYQKKETETFRAILYISSEKLIMELKSDPAASSGPVPLSRPVQQQTGFCGGYWYRFGSGTRLDGTGRAVKKPEVTVCPVKTEGRVEGDTALMCLASAMYPPLVRISWKRQKGSKEEPAPAEEKQQELSGSKSSAVIRLVKNETLYNYEYICEVQHEGGSVTNQTRFQGTKSRRSVQEKCSFRFSVTGMLDFSLFQNFQNLQHQQGLEQQQIGQQLLRRHQQRLSVLSSQ
uniref:Ig-like domain-containing protein n=1 Tax=Xiphophorus maculatus TaxID=8083 RepID=A0A3B5RFD6_XIPMA